MLAALPGRPLEPHFGPDSAARHQAVAHRLVAGIQLRLDVDTAQDLSAAVRLGVGAATQAVLATEPELAARLDGGRLSEQAPGR